MEEHHFHRSTKSPSHPVLKGKKTPSFARARYAEINACLSTTEAGETSQRHGGDMAEPLCNSCHSSRGVAMFDAVSCSFRPGIMICGLA